MSTSFEKIIYLLFTEYGISTSDAPPVKEDITNVIKDISNVYFTEFIFIVVKVAVPWD